MAILSKFQDQEAVIVDDLSLSEVKTKQVAEILKALNLKDQTCLVGTLGSDAVFYKSARNIRGVKVLPTTEFNAYTVLRQKRLVLSRAALDELRKGPPLKKQATQDQNVATA